MSNFVRFGIMAVAQRIQSHAIYLNPHEVSYILYKILVQLIRERHASVANFRVFIALLRILSISHSDQSNFYWI